MLGLSDLCSRFPPKGRASARVTVAAAADAQDKKSWRTTDPGRRYAASSGAHKELPGIAGKLPGKADAVKLPGGKRPFCPFACGSR